MDLHWMQSFVEVVRCQGFTRAAQHLKTTQPAISRHVQKLERELGIKLLERQSGTIALTPEGERFFAYATAAVEEYHHVVEELRQGTQPVSGVLRIVASTTPGEYLVPDLVASFTTQFPLVEPHILIGDSTVVIEELKSHRRDVGFVGARVHSRGIRYHAIAQDEVVLAVPIDHELAQRQFIEIEELAGQPFLEREGGSGTAISVQRELTSRGLRLPEHRIAMVLSSTDAVLSAVERGYGVGWVSSLALERRQPARAAAVRLTGVPLNRELYLAYDSGAQSSRATRAFIDWTLRQHDPQSEPTIS